MTREQFITQITDQWTDSVLQTYPTQLLSDPEFPNDTFTFLDITKTELNTIKAKLKMLIFQKFLKKIMKLNN